MGPEVGGGAPGRSAASPSGTAVGSPSTFMTTRRRGTGGWLVFAGTTTAIDPVPEA